MTKSKRILSVVLSIVMILSIIPMGVFSASAASAITNDGKLVIPQVTLEATPVFRIANPSNVYTPGNKLVNATDSGLPEIGTSNWSTQFYAGEPVHGYQVVLTSDKSLTGTPTLSCSVSTLAIEGPSKSGNTYTWVVSAGTATLSVGAIQFTADYTYSYTDNLTGQTVTKTYQAYTSSWVEKATNGVGIYARWDRTQFLGTTIKTYWINKILGKNTYGAAYQSGGKFEFGYYSFNSNSSTVDNSVTDFFKWSNDGTEGNTTYSTGVDGNRMVATTYVDRNGGSASLSSNNLRYYLFDGSDDDTFQKHICWLRAIPGISEWGDSTANDPTASGQLGLTEVVSQYDVSLNSSHNFPMTGTTYDADATTDATTGNHISQYTIIAKAGSYYAKKDRNCNVATCVSLNVVSYDKSDLRAYLQDLLRENDPLTKPASTSAIGLNPQEQWYSAGWSAYKSALVNAQNILVQPNTTQVAIDDALTTLQSAVNGLVVKEANYEALDIAEANLNSKNSAHYTPASWNNAGFAFDAAEATRGYSVFYQNAVNKAAADLNAAIDALVFVGASWDPVDEAVEAYETVDPSIWTPESFAALRSAVEYALEQKALHEADYTVNDQGLINAMAQAIWDAIDPGLQPALADYTAYDAEVARYNDVVLPEKAAIEQALTDAGIDWQAIIAAAGTPTIYEKKSWNRMQNNLNLERDILYYDQYVVDEAAEALAAGINGRTLVSADYTAVNDQLSAANALKKNQSWYTVDSYKAVTDAVAAVVTGKKINEQPAVDTMAANIAAAIAALVEAPADYTQFDNLCAQAEELDPSIYTDDSYNAVFDAIDRVNQNYNAKDQATLNTEVAAIQTALNSLVYLPADYSAIDSAKSTWDARTDLGNYTTESVAAVAKAFQDVDRTKNITQQADVNAMLANINTKIAALELKSADYTALEAKYAEAKAAVAQQTSFAAANNGKAYYTADSYAALETAIAALNLDSSNNIIKDKTILQQADVDAMLATLTTAVAGLKKNGVDVTPLETALAKIPADIEEEGIYEVNSAAAVLALAVEAQGIVDDHSAYTVDDQADINALAADLETAIAALKLNPADYSAVIAQVNRKNTDYADLSIYKADKAAAVTEALAAIPMNNGEVVQNKTIKEQAQVDAMAANLKAALDALEIDWADYTVVTAAINAANTETAKGIYTDESVAAVTEAIGNVVEGKYAKDQAEVNAMAAAINTAVANLVEKPLDLTRYNTAVASIPADLTIYTDASVAAVNNAKSAADSYKAVARNNKISNQDAFDTKVATLENAIAALVEKPLDLTTYNTAVTSVPANLSIYTDESVAAMNAAKKTADDYKAVAKNNKITNQTAFEALVADYAAAIAALAEKPLDLTSYNTAAARVPANLNAYTETSVAAMNAAKNAADEFKAANNKISKQTEFETLVSAFDTAITNLEYNFADYTELDALVEFANALNPDDFSNWDDIYWDYLCDYIETYIPENHDYTVTRQGEVDAMVETLQGYIDMLEGVLKGIEIVTEPTKTAYVTGETADYTGLAVKAIYAGGKEVTLNDGDYTVSGFDSSAAGEKTITVAYEGFEDTFTVEFTWGEGDYTAVNEKVAYINYLADNWGVDEDGTEYVNFDEIYWDYMIDYIDTGITYGLSAEFQSDIDAMAAQLQEYIDMLQTAAPAVELVSIAVKTAPAKTAYTVGDTADYTGLVIEATYSDNTTAIVTADCALSGFDSTTAGTKTITVTYEGKTATFDVTVEEAVVEYFNWANTAEVKEDGDTTYVFGFQTGMTEKSFLNNFADYENVEVTVEKSSSRYVGTGSKVIVEYSSGKVEEYIVIIYGDLDGNSKVDATDAELLMASLSGDADPLEGEFKLAADVYGTGRKTTLNDMDYAAILNVASGELELDQVSGKVIEAE